MGVYTLKKTEKINMLYLNSKDITIKKSSHLKLFENFKCNWFFLQNNKLFIPKNQLRYFLNKIASLYKSLNEEWFYEINLVGKGFKLFKYKSFLAFDLGYSNLFLYKNDKITIYATKQKLIIKSPNKLVLKNLLFCIFNFYKIDRYHGKGVIIPAQKYKIYKKLM